MLSILIDIIRHHEETEENVRLVTEIIEFLHYPPSLVEGTTMPPLHSAVCNAKPQFLAAILNSPHGLQMSSNLLNAIFMQQSPLHYAILSRSENCLLQLLAHGADPNVQTEMYPTGPLYYSVQLCQYKACKWLLAYGANPNLISHIHPRYSPLELVRSMMGVTDMETLLLQYQITDSHT